MLGVKSFDPCREFGCFQSLFFIVVDRCGPFTLAVVKSQVVLRSPFVERFHCSGQSNLSLATTSDFFDVMYKIYLIKVMYSPDNNGYIIVSVFCCCFFVIFCLIVLSSLAVIIHGTVKHLR